MSEVLASMEPELDLSVFGGVALNGGDVRLWDLDVKGIGRLNASGPSTNTYGASDCNECVRTDYGCTSTNCED